MPQRFVGLLTALCGLLVVMVMIAGGLDVYRAARSGRGWRRRLVAAGLMLLGVLGLTAHAQQAPATSPTDTPAARKAPRADLADSAEWQRLVGVWREAEEIASGRRGLYPFNLEGKAKLLSRLEDAGRKVAALQTAGLLSAAEAGLLQKDLDVLREGVQVKRPIEMQLATCYLAGPMAFRHRGGSIARLSERLPLLEEFAAADKLRPEVLYRTLGSVEDDLRVLGDEEFLKRLTAGERDKALELRERVAKQVEVIRQRVRGGTAELTDTPEWAAICAAWKTAAPLAASGLSTTAQREAAKMKLQDAQAAAEKLYAAGLLRQEESALLVREADDLLRQIYRNPPTDCQVMCYQMVLILPARASLDRLLARAELLERLAAGGRASREVIQRVSATIEADLKTLSSEAELKRLPEADRAQASQVRERVSAALEAVRKLAADQD